LRPWVAADNREIALSDIAARTKLSVDGVEYLLMKAGLFEIVQGTSYGGQRLRIGRLE